MYIYIDGNDKVAPLETEEDLLSVTCDNCGDTYTLPIEDWVDIAINGYVPCECGSDIRIPYPPLEERIY